MKQKRIWSMMLSVLMLVGMILPVHASGGTANVSISSGEVKPGGEVTLTVSIQNNPGLAAAVLYIYYDTDVFEVDPARGMSALGGFRLDGGVIGNSIELARKNGRYFGDTGKDGVLALWYNSSGMDTTDNGELLKVRLIAKTAAPAGDYKVSVGYAANDTRNEAGDKVALITGSGTVTVEGTGGNQKPAETVKPENTETDDTVFDDISGNWAEEYIIESAKRGLVNGKAPGIFDPNANMTRAEYVTILWRAMGSPAPKGKASFSDLPMAWYQEPIAWAEENQIVNGTSPTTFDPQGNVTREQMMTILHRMAGNPIGMETLFTVQYDQYFTDSASVSGYAKNAVYWSVFNEILCGEQSTALGKALAPRAAATRAQIAVSIIRYLDR